jgi:hypothetical protein
MKQKIIMKQKSLQALALLLCAALYLPAAAQVQSVPLPDASQFYDFDGTGEKGFVSGQPSGDLLPINLHRGFSTGFVFDRLLGTFRHRSGVYQGTDGFSLTLDDVNRDGKADIGLVHGCPNENADTTLISNADGSYRTVRGGLLPNADLNMDGRIDLLDYQFLSNNTVINFAYLLPQQPNGSFLRTFLQKMTPEEYEASRNQAEYEAWLAAVQAGKRPPRPVFSGLWIERAEAPDITNTKPTQCVDLNGDGVPDLTAEGTGLAFFGTESPDKYVMQSLGNRVKARDLNGDGYPDFVVWDEAAQQLKTIVYRGNGESQTTVLMSDIPADREIYCYDFDKDGDVDILATFSYPTNRLGSFWLFAENDGSGNFTVSEDGNTEQWIFSECRDVNNDGYYDLLALDMAGIVFNNIVGYESYSISNDPLPVKILYGQANLSFAAPQTLYTATGPLPEGWNNNFGTEEIATWLNAEDIDSDGYTEVWVKDGKYLHKVTAATTNTAPAAPAAPQIVFDDATGRLEISWTAATDAQSSACDLTYEIRIGTASGQGDILFAHAGANGARRNFLDGNAGATLQKIMDAQTWAPGTYYVSVQAIDPQYKGSAWSTETTFTRTDVSCRITIDKNSFAFNDSLTVFYSPAPAGYTLHWSLDGATQLASSSAGELRLQWAQCGAKTVSLQIESPDGTRSETASRTVDVLDNRITGTEADDPARIFSGELYQGSFADWDMNGSQDAALRGYTSTGLWKNNGAGSFTKLSKIFNLTFAPTDAKWMDWDKDGVMDLFYGVRDIYGQFTHGWLKNSLNDNFTKTDITLQKTNGMYEQGEAFFNMADLDNDGDLEPLEWQWNNGEGGNFHYNIYKNDGSGVFSVGATVPFDVIEVYEPDFRNHVADWNRDGFLDYYSLWEERNGYDYTYTGVMLFENHGNYSFEYKEIPFETPVTLRMGGSAFFFVFADFDNDGYMDIAYSAGEKRVQILHNQGNEQFVAGDAIVIDHPEIALLSGVSGNLFKPAVKGDLDNNGYLDLLLDVTIEKQKAGVYVIYNDGNGNYRQGLLSDMGAPLPAGTGYTSLLGEEYLYPPVDTDGDGVPNIYLGYEWDSNIAAYKVFYKNLTAATNTRPQAPTGIIATQTENGLLIEWDAAVDAETPAAQMRYNLSVKKKGATGADSYIISPLNGGNATAAALPSPDGGVSLGEWTIKHPTASLQYLYPTATRFEIPVSALPAGEVEISIQAIDLWDVASEFSETLTKKVESTARFRAPSVACFDTPVTIEYTGTQGGTPVWTFDGGTVVSGSGFGPYSVKWNAAGVKEISVTLGGETYTSQIKVLPDWSATFTLPDNVFFQTETEIGLPDVPNDATFSWSLSNNTSIFSEFTLSARAGNPKGTLRITGGGNIYRELTLTVTTPNGCTKSYTKGFNVVPRIEPPAISLVYPDASNKNVITWDVAALPQNTQSVTVYKESSVFNSFYAAGMVPAADGAFTDIASNNMVKSERYAISALLAGGVESPKSSIHQTMHLTINRGISAGQWNLIWSPYQGRGIATYRILRGATPDNLTMLSEVSGAVQMYSDMENPSEPYYAIEYVPAAGIQGAAAERRTLAVMQPASADPSGRSNVVYSGDARNVIYVTSMNIMTVESNPELSEEQPSLYLYAELFPANATYQNITWSITAGNNLATIDALGRLQASGNTAGGTVTVRAAAADGSGVSATRSFTVGAFTAASVDAATPVISVHPQSATYTVGAAATPLSVSASVSDGGTLSYQWYSNTTNSDYGATPVGANSATYTPLTAAAGTLYYIVTVTNTNPAATGAQTASVTSNVAVVTVNNLVNAATPAITTHPQGATYTVGASATALSVTASVSDGGTLSYQWYSNTSNSNSGGTLIAGAATASYSPPTAVAGTVYYYVTVTNTNPAATGAQTASVASNVAAVTVNNLVNAATPAITTQPQGATYTVNATAAALSVTASVSDGGTLSYQWYSNTTNSNSGGSVVSSNPSYTPPTSATGTLYYYVIVTNTNNSATGNKTATITSNVAAIMVKEQEPLTFTGFALNQGNEVALFRTVDLRYTFSGGHPTHFMASEHADLNGAEWKDYTPAGLTYTFASDERGVKTVYTQLKNDLGETGVKSAAILYKPLHAKLSLTAFSLNNQAAHTTQREVTLNHTVENGVPAWYSVAGQPGQVGAEWLPYTPVPVYTLPGGAGLKEIFFAVANETDTSEVLSDQIYLDEATTVEAHGLTAKVFPNPVENELHFIVDDVAAYPLNVTVYTITGEVYFSQGFTTSSFSINLARCPAGVLLVRIAVENKYVIKRIIKL